MRKVGLFRSILKKILPRANPAFLAYSNPIGEDFAKPEYLAACRVMKENPYFHRKQWEFVYIYWNFKEHGVLAPQKRGLGFGVGKEPLPAIFASLGCEIMATDAPSAVVKGKGWTETDQHIADVEDLRYEGFLPKDTFLAQVEYAPCDMNNIGANFVGYDFCWSACALEHLGSLRAGMDFIIASVEKTLKIGGVACHTTEFNIGSNDETLESGGTVLYRKRDLEQLISELTARGHSVDPLRVNYGRQDIDRHIDLPPYSVDRHLKLRLDRFDAT